MERRRYWTEALAVGSETWIDRIKGKVGKKRIRVIDTHDFGSGNSNLYTEKADAESEFVREEKAPFVID